MTNRTDWEQLSKDIVDEWSTSVHSHGDYGPLRDRIETELHNAYVAGAEGSPEVWAQFQAAAPVVHINRIEHADDPDRLAFGLVDAFTKKVTAEMAIPTNFGPLTIKSDPTMRPNEIRMDPDMWSHACGCVVEWQRRGEPCTSHPPLLVDGLTPEQCRDRWETNAAAIESGMATPYALSPDQIAEGKRLHLAGGVLARASRCQCHIEAGDSLCPVHPPPDEELEYAASIGAPYQIVSAELSSLPARRAMVLTAEDRQNLAILRDDLQFTTPTHAAVVRPILDRLLATPLAVDGKRLAALKAGR